MLHVTGIESPVTITTSPGATSARCVCGWAHQIPARPGEITAYSEAMDAWAEHWHDTHTEHESENT